MDAVLSAVINVKVAYYGFFSTFKGAAQSCRELACICACICILSLLRINPGGRREKGQIGRDGLEMFIVDYRSMKCAYSAQKAHSSSKRRGGNSIG